MRLAALTFIVLLRLSAPSQAAPEPVPATVSACFTPGPESCAKLIVNRIDEAKSTVRIQAYYLTAPQILQALTAAKRRGVDVAAILDKSQDRRGSNRSRYSSATYLFHAGIPVWIDDGPSIAHNKIIILDEHVVITGSFNFTRNADERNAENIVILDSPDVARWFGQNWEARRSDAYSFEAE